MITVRWPFMAKIVAVGVLAFILAACDQTPDAESLISEIDSYLVQGKVEEASIVAKNLVLIDPRNAHFRHISASTHRRAGLLEQAISEAERANRLAPDQLEYRLEMARALFVAGRFEDAKRSLSGLQNTAEQQLILAHIERLHGKKEQARSILKQILTTEPEHASALAALGWLDLEQSVESAEARYRQIPKADREQIDVRHLAAELAHRRGDHSTSNSLFKQLVKNEPFDHPVPITISYARSLIDQKNYKKAARALEIFLIKRPGLTVARYYRALVAYNERDFVMARQWIESVTDSHPGHSASRLLYGAVMIELGHERTGESHIKAYVAQKPDDTAGRLLLARLMMSEGREDEARRLLIEASRAGGSGEFADVLQKFDHALNIPQQPLQSTRAQASATIADPVQHEAGTSLRDLVQPGLQSTETDAVRLQTALVSSHLSQGDFSSAWKVVGEWKSSSPDAARPQALAGVIHLSTGNKDKARAAFEQALEKDSFDVTATINLSDLEREADNLENAKHYLTRYQQEKGQHPDMSLRLAQIADIRGKHAEADALISAAHDAFPLHSGIVEAYALRKIMRREYALALDAIGGLTPRQDDETASQTLSASDSLGKMEIIAAQSLGRYSRAREVLDQFSAQQTTDPILDYLNGKQYLAEGETDLAMHYFMAATDNETPFMAARIAEFRLLLRQGQIEKAQGLLPEIEIAVENPRARSLNPYAHQPDHLTMWLPASLRSELSQSFGHHDQAIRDAEEALRLSGQAHELVIVVQRMAQRGLFEEALHRLTADRARFGNSARLGLLQAQLEQRLGQTSAALETLEDLFDQFPKNAIVANNFAFASLSAGKTRAAMLPAQRAFNLAGENEDPIRDTYALALMQNGKAEKALTLLSDLARRHPNNIDYRLHYAEALALAGHKKAARNEVRVLEAAIGQTHREPLARLKQLVR